MRCTIYFREELEQWMADGVHMKTVQDGCSVVCSATHWTAFSVIAYDSLPVSLSLSLVCVCVCVCVRVRVVCVCVCVYCVCVHCVCVCVCLMVRIGVQDRHFDGITQSYTLSLLTEGYSKGIVNT